MPLSSLHRSGRVIVAGALLALLAACAEKPAPPALSFRPASFTILPGWQTDATAAALPALARSCTKIMARPAGQNDKGRGLDGFAQYGTPEDWRPFCTALGSLKPGDDGALRHLIETQMQPVAVLGDGDAQGLFTGYYEPLVRGSRKRHGPYQTPLYRQPPDLVQVDLGEFRDSLKGQRIAGRVQSGRLKPYEDRGGIEAGSLTGRNLELVWLDSAVDAFFLQVQGSGLVQLDDGGQMRVGFAAQNGHPYVAIGRVLIARGEMSRDAVSLQSIRAWLAAHPAEAPALMRENPSYVFFRELPKPKDDSDGPLGAEGVALLPGRSLAVDRKHFALGVPVWLDSTRPAVSTGEDETPLRRLLVAQDTGGAITGGVRGDVFWGHGAEAEALAGRMKQPGRLWLLLPKAVAAKLTRAS